MSATPAPLPDSEPFIDLGLPLPESYDVDVIRAMLQDPFRILIYWEVRPQSLAALTRYFSPADIGKFHCVLKLTEIGGGHEAWFEVAHRGRYWMLVFPDREYEFEIGVRSPEHGFISLVKSNRVRTPRGTVSFERAEEPEYQLSAGEFIDVLDATGFGVDQTLEVTLAAMAEAGEESAIDDRWSGVIARLPDSIRRALALASSGGELTQELIDELPEPIRSELLKLLVAGDGRIASVGLLHYLPELLHEAAAGEEWIGDHIHPLHITQRFMTGGTENVALPGGEVRWPVFARRPSSA
jgi:hypothetical protein